MTPAPRPVFQTDLDLPGLRRGKVRDVYDLPPGIQPPDARAAGTHPSPGLLIVASDRISAFDVVMPTPIPGKGQLLTGIATFWLRWIESKGLCRTHLVSTDAGLIPKAALGRTPRADLEGRVMLARRCRVIPIECVARGYLEGSGWKEYQQTGSVCGIKLPAGLKQCDQLPEPIFTPATKEEQGKHDENVSFERAAAMVGGELMEKLRTLTLRIYKAAAEHARERGIIIADTKFEFGLPADGGDSAEAREPILIDEALTPDSSRFWPAAEFSPGRPQKSYDKQFLREHLESLVARGAWNKQAPGPELPPEIVEGTRARYQTAFDQLTR
jgi:phosphoribosylaminoimidazole-succinocarboxamide synthase